MIEEFYLNDKLVSVRLSYMEENDAYIWTDSFFKPGFFRDKKVKLKETQWLSTTDILYYQLSGIIEGYKSDKELLENINPLGVNKYSIKNKKVYLNANVSFKYMK